LEEGEIALKEEVQKGEKHYFQAREEKEKEVPGGAKGGTSHLPGTKRGGSGIG